MKSKYLIFDLDETLLDSNMLIRKKTLEAIDLFARKNNFLISIATGRSLGMSLNYIKEIKVDNYAVLANGNFLYDVKKNKLIPTSSPLETDVKKFIIDYLFKQKNGLVLFTDVGDYFYSLTNLAWDEFKDFSASIINLNNKSYEEFWDFVKKVNVYCISMFLNLETVNEAKQNFLFLENKKLCRVTSAAKRFIDISSGNISKYDGFIKMCELINIDFDNTYFFGDSENDYELICKIKNSVAMGNACDKVKSKAKYVLKGTNNTDIIYDFLKEKFCEVKSN